MQDGINWLPQAWIASLQYTKAEPRSILRAMIAEYIEPKHLRQMDDEDLEAQFRLTAKQMGAKGL